MKTTEKILTNNELSISYFEYNLNVIRQVFENKHLSKSKKQQITNMINEMAELVSIHESHIKNSYNQEELTNFLICEKISKLELINQITNF